MLNKKRQHGFTLVDAMIGALMLAVGQIGLIKFESYLITSNQLAQLRANASFAASKLLSAAYADSGNAACYTVPVASQSGCNNATASTFTANWVSEVTEAFPGTTSNPPIVTLDVAAGTLAVNIYWQQRQGTLHTFAVTGQTQ